MKFELQGEVTSIGRAVTNNNDQKIEIDITPDNGIRFMSLYVSFQGVSPYALGQRITLTLQSSTEQEPTTKENTNASD